MFCRSQEKNVTMQELTF